MSDDWESVTHIGSRTRGGGNNAPRMTLLRTNASLNAALRSGTVDTSKKPGSANSVSLLPLLTQFMIASWKRTDFSNQTSGIDAGRAAKLDNDEKVTALKSNLPYKSVMDAERKKKGYNSRADLARACSLDLKIINDLENDGKLPDSRKLNIIQGKLGIHLGRRNFNQPIIPKTTPVKVDAEKQGKKK
jgi:putative transcription factor